mgnify:CR=1 FL=1
MVTTTQASWPYFDTVGIPLSQLAEIVERFTPSDDGQRLNYLMTVTDPVVFTEPVTLEKYWVWVPENSVEPYDCTVN